MNSNQVSLYTIKQKNIVKSNNKNDKKKNIKELNEFNEELFNKIKNDKNFIITLGGDHSIAISTILASKQKNDNLGIIWIDSHADYHNFDTTISGNIHGTPFATVTGQNKDEVSYFAKGNYVDPKNVVLLGARDVESPEYINLEKAGVKVITTEDIKKGNIKEIVRDVFNYIKAKNIHISFDLDVTDPIELPGVSVKAKDGLSINKVQEIIDEVLNNIERIKSFDIVEFNPLLDKNDITYNVLNEILEKLINKLK